MMKTDHLTIIEAVILTVLFVWVMSEAGAFADLRLWLS